VRHIRNRLTNKNFYILFGLDAVFVFVSILGSILLRYEFIFPIELYQFFQPVHIILILLIKLGSFSYFGLYRGMWRYTSIWDMINVIKANILASGLCITLIWFTLGFKGISKSIFVLDFMIFSFLAGSSRLGVRIYFNHILKSLRITKKSRSIRKVIIIGAGDTGQAILRQSLEQPEERIKVVGFLDNNPSKIGSSLHDIPVLGPIDSLVNHTGLFDEILICIPSASRKEMRNIIEICKQSGKLFKTLPSITELVQGRFTISEFKEVSLVDLLGREEVNLDKNSINELIHGKRVLITGAGGSIGSELVRQCLKYEPAVLVMLDLSEYNLFEIDREIMALDFSSVLFKPVLCDIRDKDVLAQVFDEFEPQVVLHAAAYKHVPMQETFPWEAVKTNVLGTANLTHIALKHMVEKFVLVSTDKAVKPVNVMGATKRLAELIVQSANTPESQFIAVRFGNVLGSSGSVIPIFQEQIRNGGPVTVTDPDMQRYFMSVSEASQLILQAGALGEGGGEVFVLDMGEPLRILDIANELIRLSGYEPELDIPINFIGPRPGEKKVEELVLDNEMLNDTRHDKIFVLKENIATPEVIDFIKTGIYELELDISQNSASQIRRKLSLILPEYDPDLGAGEPIYLNIKAKAQA
tara:strand:- start:2306 stop:4225 length:1920 start_codon:yes stop_codon:yes gene_type:complete